MGIIDFKIPDDRNEEEFKLEASRQRFVSKVLLSLGFPTIIYFAINDLFIEKSGLDYLQCLMFIVLVGLLIALVRPAPEKRKYVLCRFWLYWFILLFVIKFVYEVLVQRTFFSTYWCYLFPMLIFFLVRLREGLICTIVFYAGIVFSLFYSDFQSISLTDLKLRFFITFSFVSVGSFLSAYMVARDQERLLHNQRTLSKEITERRRAEQAVQRSEEEARRLAQENAAMAEIGRIISSTLNIEEVYERFAQEVRKLISFDRIIINILNPHDDTQTLSYTSGIDVESRRSGAIVPLAGTATGECMRTRKSFLFQTESMDEVANRFPGLLPSFKTGLRSMIFVPLISKDQVIGVLSLRSIKLNAYAEEDLRLTERVANQIAGAIANAQLFTERMKAEQKARALEEQLRQSQRIEAIGRLAGGIAHDFNNLLTVIKGYSELLLFKLKAEDPLRSSIEEIRKASQRAADLTRQLLAFSRRQILEFKVLDLNSILRNMENMLRRLIGEDIELVYRLSDHLGKIRTDSGQIEQVVLNLTVNARDAMPSGGKLTIETANVELDEAHTRGHIGMKPGRYVMLSVSDTGCGMSPEVKEHLFEPFFTTKEWGKGTGLGLSTVYGIVKQSGGDIWVYSELNQGTTIKIYLPEVEEEADLLLEQDAKASLPSGKETILLVEDEPSVKGFAARVLSESGYHLLEAANGHEAFRIAQEYAGKIDLLLTDVVMPQMGGKELADRVKALHPQLKVLFTSGYTDNTIVHHGVLDPGILFLQKPFSPETLLRRVREALDR